MKQFLLIALFLLSGCTGTAVTNSVVLDRSAKPVSEVRLLYIENQLTGINEKNSIVNQIEYPKLGALLQERAPIVFNLNKIPVEVIAVKPNDLIGAEAKRIQWKSHPDRALPLLELQVLRGRTLTNAQGVTTVDLEMQATLHAVTNDVPGAPMQRVWVGKFETSLGAGLGTVVFSAQFVDEMLMGILESMADAKMVNLPSGKALIPNSRAMSQLN
jgi:hypothetical protein